MTRRQAAQLLAIIQLSYPTFYRDLDDKTRDATVNMWHASFWDVPYPLMEQGLNRYRMTNKYPPTVAEMVEELRHLHYQAMEQVTVQQMLGNNEAVQRCLLVMRCTDRYKEPSRLGDLTMGNLMSLQLEDPAYRQGIPEGEPNEADHKNE